jgi:hypothetical protein
MQRSANQFSHRIQNPLLLVNPTPNKWQYVSGHYSSSCFYQKHRPVYISKHSFPETGLYLRLQAKPTQLNQIDRASLYKEDGVLNKNRTMDNVQKHNICALKYTSM